ncbi:carboxypeptidase-like regulatory domain-containing protein [Polaribacter sp. KT 15]|uniref:carboxypeptidase-like regulatory domain-containing protein n=1 Tax=Polaribacter sp. KT 15 TaxID=1896175 RepID=UPI00090C3AEC|nr:carboxypeptidase-like regulatory domain-containing protein [Polaribacter sp. KT 15]SHM98808.1 CarboxypepD_reg-like domain-containing protein [Polaribacter sp. KT 15]
MKDCIYIIVLFLSSQISSQITIKGTVLEKSDPLEGAAVYFNNTMLGTTTNSNGEFSIKVKEGQYDLIVSYLGYKKINYTLNTSNYTKPLVFNLKQENSTLDEIILRKTVYNDEWKYNLSTFKKEFIGRTEIAKDCEILNPEVLHFTDNSKKNILTAIAKKPLEIKHKSLGYKIIFELEEFVINNKTVTYLGYSRYQNLKGSKRKKRKWQQKRLETYNGSFTHFYQSLLKGTTYLDGYLIHQFKRVLNPDRPSESVIKKARELVKLYRNKINFLKKIEIPKTPLDSALVTLKKAKLPKFKDYLYKSKVPIKDILKFKNGVSYLNFKNNLSIVYTKELEEEGYILRAAFSKPRKALPQTSSIIPLKLPTIIDKNGTLINPLNVFYEGYWSYEKFANSLPLDYDPKI